MIYDYAINELEIALDVVETNYPINLKEGNTEQAELELQVATSCKAAIELLKQNESNKEG